MRYLHSLNTIPIFNIPNHIIPSYYRFVGTIICASMSVAWLKYYGKEIVLHTDTLGKDMLKFLPYDEIHLTLDEIPENIHPSYFAVGKMFALEKEPINTCHLDYDVFLKKPEVFDLIENTNYDLLVQQIETGEKYRDLAGNVYENDPEFFKNMGLNLYDTSAYNTGIVNFRNQELKDKFIDNYKKIITHYSHVSNDILNKEKDEHYIPDLYAEQVNIYQISKDYNVYPLLGHKIKKGYAHDIGYQHLLTSLKFTRLNKVMEMLSVVDTEIYKQTKSVVDDIMQQTGRDTYNLEIFEDEDDVIVN